MSYKISVKVTPGAKKELVEYLEDEKTLRIRTSAPPIEGKANEKVIELVAKYLDLPKSLVKISKGQGTKNKIVEVDAVITEADLIKRPKLL